MSDKEIFDQECLNISNCAKEYFGGEDLPQSLELCIDTAIKWIVGSDYPPLFILGQRILRTGLSLPSYHVCSLEPLMSFLVGFLGLCRG